METYYSPYSPSEVRELILQTAQSWNLVSGSGITETSFKLHTKEIPPGMISGSMQSLPAEHAYQTKITFSVDSPDEEKGAAMLLYVLSYICIAIIFTICVIKYPTNVWVYIITGVACLLPPPLIRLYQFLESSPPVTERVKEEFLKKIKAVRT